MTMKGGITMTLWKKRRQASGLSKNDMANELGLTFNYYDAIERGDVKMPSNLIDKFNEIINRGKQNELTNVENNVKADEFWNTVRQKKPDGGYVLTDKMHDFNIPNMNELVKLLGYKSSGTIWNYLQGRNPAGAEFKKRLYNFFNNELNIQIPTKVVGSGKKQPRRLREPIVDKELDKYFEETDFKKILKDNGITNVQIAAAIGVHNSTVSNMTSKKFKPSYKVMADVKAYLDKALAKEEPVVDEPLIYPEIPTTEMPKLEPKELVPNYFEEEKKSEPSTVVRRYENELTEIDNVLEMYKSKMKELEIRKKICVEVLNAINEFRTVGE